MASQLVLLLVGIKLISLTSCDEIDVEQMQSSLAQIGRQLMLQQLFLEERIRSDGDSGLKIIRLNSIGSRPYHATGLSSAKKVNISFKCLYANRFLTMLTTLPGHFI